jgi:hypothetical protein
MSGRPAPEVTTELNGMWNRSGIHNDIVIRVADFAFILMLRQWQQSFDISQN